MGRLRKVVLIICQSEHHGLLGKLRYIVMIHDHGIGWVDDATWKDFKQITRQNSWAHAKVVFGLCAECEVIKSLI